MPRVILALDSPFAERHRGKWDSESRTGEGGEETAPPTAQSKSLWVIRT
jgi:hypothetical protein